MTEAHEGNGKTRLIRTVGLRQRYTTEEVETTALENVNVEIAADGVAHRGGRGGIPVRACLVTGWQAVRAALANPNDARHSE